MNPNQLTFLVLAGIAIAGALGVVFFPSPVRAALSLVLNFLTLAILYFMLGAELMGISQVMVYAGAIMVLFLFVVMIIKQGQDEQHTGDWKQRFVLGFVLFASLAGLIYSLGIAPFSGLRPRPAAADFGTPEQVGWTLFSQYVWPFEIASILLLVGIVASVMLAKRRL